MDQQASAKSSGLGRTGPPGWPVSEILDSLLCPSPRKSRRSGRPLGEKAKAIRAAVADLTDDYSRMTVRQVFYALETCGVVEKTEAGYRQVQTQVLRMREDGLLDWEFITDGTRWQRK